MSSIHPFIHLLYIHPSTYVSGSIVVKNLILLEFFCWHKKNYDKGFYPYLRQKIWTRSFPTWAKKSEPEAWNKNLNSKLGTKIWLKTWVKNMNLKLGTKIWLKTWVKNLNSKPGTKILTHLWDYTKCWMTQQFFW